MSDGLFMASNGTYGPERSPTVPLSPNGTSATHLASRWQHLLLLASRSCKQTVHSLWQLEWGYRSAWTPRLTICPVS